MFNKNIYTHNVDNKKSRKMIYIYIYGMGGGKEGRESYICNSGNLLRSS